MKKILFAFMAFMLAFTSCQQSAGSDEAGVSPTPSSSATEATEYTVSVTQPDFGGTVSVDKAKAKASETVTITTTANDGFELETISVKNGEATVTVTDKKFTMPSGNVTVNAAFAASSYTVKWDNGHFDNKFSLAKVKAYITQIGLVETTDYSIDKKNGVLTFTSDGYAKVAAYLSTNGEPTVTETPADNGGNGTGDAGETSVTIPNVNVYIETHENGLGLNDGKKHGSFKLSKEGNTVTITVLPETGYELGYVIKEKSNGLGFECVKVDDNPIRIDATYQTNGGSSSTKTTLSLDQKADGTYTFEMPSGNVIVNLKARFDPVGGYTVKSDYFPVKNGQVTGEFTEKEIKVIPGNWFTVKFVNKSKVNTLTLDNKSFTGFLTETYACYCMPAHDVAVTTTLKNQQ